MRLHRGANVHTSSWFLFKSNGIEISKAADRFTDTISWPPAQQAGEADQGGEKTPPQKNSKQVINLGETHQDGTSPTAPVLVFSALQPCADN